MSSILFGKKSTKDVDYKARLEHKLYLAREDPEPVFDLSECNLKSVPSGIYSLCKVFRKEALLLQVNQLTSLAGGGQLSDLILLKQLNLHDNCLSSLPEDIKYMTSLEELNVSNNQLRKLPDVFKMLVKLKRLDCSHNKLKCLPPSLGQVLYVDLQNNPSLPSLPPSLVMSSAQLLVDKHLQITQVPFNIQATQENLGCETGATDSDFKSNSKMNKMEPQEAFSQKEKFQEMLAIEEDLRDQKEEECRLHLSVKEDKHKLLMNLREQQKKLEENVSRCQIRGKKRQKKLLKDLLEEEKSAVMRINDLLAVNQALQMNKVSQEQDLWEQELLTQAKDKTTQLQKQQVLDAMQTLLVEEQMRKEIFLNYEKTRAEVAQDSLSKEVEWSEQVNSVLDRAQGRLSSVAAAVEADSEVQRALVATLLEQTDVRAQALVMQVSMVQHELAALTSIELHRRQANTQHLMNELITKRKALSELMVSLMNEQQERRKQLIDTIQHLDIENQEERRCDFWLRQYQHLLSLGSPQLACAAAPELVHEMVTAGVAHCLPLLSHCNLQHLTTNQLIQLGVVDVEEQAAILSAVETYQRNQTLDEQMTPSAPPEDDFTPSCPPAPSPPPPHHREPLPECVVCMEHECTIVFVPCGHLCSCLSCASQLQLCPLCRASLERKIHVILP